MAKPTKEELVRRTTQAAAQPTKIGTAAAANIGTAASSTDGGRTITETTPAGVSTRYNAASTGQNVTSTPAAQVSTGQSTASTPATAQVSTRSTTPYYDTGNAAPQSTPYYDMSTVPQTNTAAYDALRQQAQQTAEASRLNHVDTSPLRESLDRERALGQQQAENTINYGVTRGVNELARVQQDAQQQYDTQLSQISRDEALARDNQALYAAARGDRGGIAAAQYDAIANRAAVNRQTVNSARIKLATDTQRQIADLRAQGEFQKADAALQLTQQYLAQLRQMEQWAIETNLSVDQFNAQMNQWLSSYLMQVQQMETAENQYNQEMAFRMAEANRDQQNTVWNQWWAQSEANRAQNNWQTEFNRGVLESDRAYQYQLGRDRVEDQRYAQEYADSRADVQWNRNYQIGRDAVEDQRYSQQYADSRADVQWNRNYQMGRDAIEDQRYNQQYADSRADVQWNRNYQIGRDAVEDQRYNQQYADSRADTARQQGFQERAEIKSRVDDMLNMGIVPRDKSMLAIAGYDTETAELIADTVRKAQQIEAEDRQLAREKTASEIAKNTASASGTAAKSGTSGTSATGSGMKLSTAESMANQGTWTENMYNALLAGGYTDEDLRKLYGDDEEFKAFMGRRSGLPTVVDVAQGAVTRAVNSAGKAATAISKGSTSKKSSVPSVTDAVKSAVNSAVSRATTSAMPDSRFQQAMRGVVSSLENNNTKTAQTTVNGIWDQLSPAQKKQLQETLSQYGLNYTP